MPYFQFKNIKISAIVSAVPSTIVNVDDYAPIFGFDKVSKFKNGTGIYQYRKTKESQTASDLCYAAAKDILEKKNIDKSELGALIFVAHSTDYRRPATACVLHKRLGLQDDCVAFDISLGCSAFVYGIQTICSLMTSSNIKKALLLVGETLTKMAHPMDQTVAMLFGDAGSAILFEKTESTNDEISGILKSDGNGYRSIIAPAGGFRNMNAPKQEFVCDDGSVRTLYNTIMNGEDVFGFTISKVPRTIKEFLTVTNTTINDYDCLALHQANLFILKTIAKKIKADLSQIPYCLDRYGNTSAAAIPLVICDKYGNTQAQKTVQFLMCGFGVGLSWGVCSAKISTDDIYPIIETDDIFEEGIINDLNDL